MEQLLRFFAERLTIIRVWLDAEEFRSLLAQTVRVAGELLCYLHIGVMLHQQIERVLAQLRRDTRRMPEPDRIFSCVNKSLQQIVYCKVTRCYCQNPPAIFCDLADQLHQCGGLACAGWTMNDSNIFGTQGKLDRLNLRRVQLIVEWLNSFHFLKKRFLNSQQYIA